MELRDIKKKPFVIAVTAAMAGYAALWLPWAAAVSTGASTAPNMIDGMQPISLLLLALIGLVSGMVVPQRFWLGGISSMILFPVMAAWDITRDPTSHNLLPIELMIYAALAVPGVVAGFVGKSILRFVRRV